MLFLSQRISSINGLAYVPLVSRRNAVSRTFRPFVSTLQRQETKATLEDEIHDNNQQRQPLPRVLLKRNRTSKNFRDGSQLVFSGSIDKTPKSLQLGDLVQVEVPSDTISNDKHARKTGAPAAATTTTATTVVGWGVYNPESMYRIRILCHSLLHPDMKSILSASVVDVSTDNAKESVLHQILLLRFQKALQTRRTLGLPSVDTDTFRLVNGEGDSLSGLAVDVIADKVAVVMSSAAWCEIHKDAILRSLHEVIPEHQLIWKTTPSRLKQDGYSDNTSEEDTIVTKQQEDSTDALVAMENGVKYQTFPHLQGQKTGVYCDQRENRRSLADLCSNKSVLDLCCYHGGFSLNAAKQGASRVVGVDSSGDAIETCNTNIALNDFCKDVDISFVKSDISDYMKQCQETFQVVVLDPPKLAPSVSGLPRATRKYHSLNRDAIKLIDDQGGLLLTCTCSAAMTQKDGGRHFLEMVQQASLAARREVSLLKVSGAAPCHTQSPISFPAGNYLTAALFMVHPK
ncbi:S-adenosylmethionine-dependent methyltransferase [Nitzschia inconspicua]|uniref:S-adenosylmethionine-dependent methyltransferase n=1 Tax=Nitzschia inconspicua TaxID=303405 RepID=A0A9K3PDW9_9STRA|nr:S-adenosylmethionine-dependent methyltransferase [Nitzschia inconspicua]